MIVRTVTRGTARVKFKVKVMVHSMILNTPQGPLDLLIEPSEGTDQDCFLPGMVDALGSEMKRVSPVKGPVSDASWLVSEPGVPPVEPCFLLSSPAPFRPVIERDGVHWKHRLDQQGDKDCKPKEGSQERTCNELEDDRSIGGDETTKKS